MPDISIEENKTRADDESATQREDSLSLHLMKGDDVLDDHHSTECMKDEPVIKKAPRKSVGFAPVPVDDLNEHHKKIRQQSENNLKSSPFWKVPPELSYLEHRGDAPKPLSSIPPKPIKKTNRAVSLDDLPDLPSRAVKEISVVNKNTVLNFNYHEVALPIRPDRILVEVKYGSLSSLDMTKLRKYAFNFSNERIGIGYNFVGVIVGLGRNNLENVELKKGTKVFGVTNPDEKKGSLQTCVIINPSDILLTISDQDLEEMGNVDVELSPTASSKFAVEDDVTEEDNHSTKKDGNDDSTSLEVSPVKASGQKPKKDSFKIESKLTPMAKFSVFGSEYCRAKQALSVIEKMIRREGSANILINGADTSLGFTLLQTLASSAYHHVPNLNVTSVVLEKNFLEMESFACNIGSGGSRNFNVVSFDMVNEDLVLPGEELPINYKKVAYFATEIFESMLKIIPLSEKIDKKNINSAKLDLFIDIIGCKKMFQKSINVLKFDDVNFPFKQRLAPSVRPSSLFGKVKEPLFLKLLKPKSAGSSLVSFCNFDLSEPSYSVDKLVTYKGAAFDPWASSWSQGLANKFVGGYNYYEKFDLQIKKEWVEEAYQLVKSGELRMKIDKILDWRNDFRKHMEDLRKHDGHIVLKVESF